MQDARKLGLVTGGTDAERSDTYGLNMAPKSTEDRVAERQEARRTEVAALREEFTGAAKWDAGRRLEIRRRLAQLSATVYADRFEAPEEYEIDRLRALGRTAVSPDALERIQGKLAALGTVMDPVGSPRYEEYRKTLREALADPNAWNFLE